MSTNLKFDKPKTALVAGAWSSNIGNAFFNLGAEWLLRDIGCDTYFVPESPRWKEDVPISYDAVADAAAGLVVLAGPCLWGRLKYVYQHTFEKLYSRGIKVGYLSAGMATYTEAEADEVVRFFTSYPPAFVSTRDQACFELLAPKANFPLHSGICTSMFLNDAILPLPLYRPPFVVFNFDEVEPEIRINESWRAQIVRRNAKICPVEVHGLDIIRTNNLSIDEGYKAIYRRPNTYHSDLPQGYCSILSCAERVYSERVHTCATALVYGRPAQFISVSRRSHDPRSQLFQRLGVPEIFERPVTLDMAYIAQEKDAMRSFVRGAIASNGL